MTKQTYLCVQRSQQGGAKREQPSPEQMQQMYAAFTSWREKHQNNLVDLGGRLGAGKIVTVEGEIDGPSTEMREVIGGYMIVSAGSLAEAVEIARQCPGLVGPGSGVEVREIRKP